MFEKLLKELGCEKVELRLMSIPSIGILYSDGSVEKSVAFSLFNFSKLDFAVRGTFFGMCIAKIS